MHQRIRFAPVTLALVIAVALVASGGPLVGFAHAGDNKVVRLTVRTEPSGRQAIKVIPVDAKIWRNKPDKPKKVQPNKKPDIPNAQWPYSVTVYACVDGAKAQEVATLDPRIIWKD